MHIDIDEAVDIGRPEIQEQEQPDDSNGHTTNAAFPTIYKLSDDERCQPYHVSIGPYYRGNSFLCREAEKRKYLTKLSDVAGERVEDLEQNLRTKIGEKLANSGTSCYYGGPHQEESQLEQILLLDGCYLIAHYVDVVGTMTTAASQQGGTSSSKQTWPHSGPLVRDTWCLLQNQIPFFVLEEIYKGVTGGRDAIDDVRTEFSSYARELLWNQKMYNIELAPNMVPRTVFHLLHLLHTFFEPSNPLVEARSNIDNNNNNNNMFHRLLCTLLFCFKPRNPRRNVQVRSNTDNN